jgi:hypothetical protein
VMKDTRGSGMPPTLVGGGVAGAKLEERYL